MIGRLKLKIFLFLCLFCYSTPSCGGEMKQLNGPPPMQQPSEIESQNGPEFEKCNAFQDEIFHEMKISPESKLYTFSKEWGFVLRATFIDNDAESGMSFRRVLVCWNSIVDGKIYFSLDYTKGVPLIP